MLSLRRNAGQNDEGTARFLYAILRQLECRSVDWDQVAEDIEATNGHAARMRWTRFKSHMEGGATNSPQQTSQKVSKRRKVTAKKTKKRQTNRQTGSDKSGTHGEVWKIEEQESEEKTNGDENDDDDENEDDHDDDNERQQTDARSVFKMEQEGENDDEDGGDDDAANETEPIIKEEPALDIAASLSFSGLTGNDADLGFLHGEDFDELMNDPFFLNENF